MTNKPLSKLKSEVSYRDHKRTWQGVSNELLSYLYYTCIVHASFSIHMLSISPPYCYYKTNIFPDIIVLVSFTLFQTYDIISCDHGYIPLHCSRKEILNQEKWYCLNIL